MALRDRARGVGLFTAGAVAAIATALVVVSFISFRLVGPRGDSESLIRGTALARQTAESQIRANRYDLAEQTCRQALVGLDGLADRSAGDPRYRRERAALADALGVCLVERDMPYEAVPAYKQAIDLWSKLLAEDPSSFDDRCRLATCLNRLGTLYRDAGRWDEAESTFSRGRLLCEKLPERLFGDPSVTRDRVAFLDQLGRLLLEAGRPSEAIEMGTIAVATQKALTSSAARTKEDREAMVGLLLNLAGEFTGARRPADAERALAEAGEVAEGLGADFPATARYHDMAATVLEWLARTIKSQTARDAEARERLGRALTIREKLVAGAPESAEDLAKVAATCEGLASLCRDHGAFNEAEAFYRKGLSYQSRVTRQHPGAPTYRYGHGRLLHNLADLLRVLGRRDEAVLLARHAVEQLGALYRDDLKNPDYRTAFSYACWTLCALLLDHEDERGTAEAVAEYLKIEPSGYEEPLEAARFLCRCARLFRSDPGSAASQSGTAGNAHADQAMSLLVIAVRNGFRDIHDLETSAVYDPLRSRADFQRLLHDVELIAAGAGHG